MREDFADALAGLRAGDFSRLKRLFRAPSAILAWFDAGAFATFPRELAEALTCACFLGAADVAERLLAAGVDPNAGDATGPTALHWAANGGHRVVVALLLRYGAALETGNMYDGTPLSGTVWSLLHQPRAGQRECIEDLLRAGADPRAVELPTGDAALDALLATYAKP